MLSFDRMVLDWARKQPADAKYDYASNDDCALCQFLRATGICAQPRVGGDYWRDDTLGFRDSFDQKHSISSAMVSALVASPRSLGGLAERLSGQPTDIFLARTNEAQPS
jgi:hypothetical protein